jgi:uncharacterized protein
LTSIFPLSAEASIARTFFAAAPVLGATRFYGWMTRRDLSAIGSFFVMGPIGNLVLRLVNIFMMSSAP